MTNPAPPTPAVIQGMLDHVALATRNLDITLAFYREVVGLRVLGSFDGNALHGRHGAVGDDGSAYLHFFEHPDAPTRETDAVTFFRPGLVQHIALALPDAQTGLALRDRLAARQVPMTPVMEQRTRSGPGQHFMFLDNNGLQLEAIWPRGSDATNESEGGER